MMEAEKKNKMFIMCGDEPVVQFENDFSFKILNYELAPLYIKNRGAVLNWICDRAADSTRANTRAVKAVSGLSRNANDYLTATKFNAATITDNFWVKDENDTITYDEVSFKKNAFFSLALYRDSKGLDKQVSRTPELTNIGQQEKGWKKEDGVWWLYKNESIDEIISEYITYRIGEALGYAMAEYEIVEGGRFIKSRDFTNGVFNLQHIDGIMTGVTADGTEVPDDDYSYNYNTLKNISEDLAEKYIDICCLDAICENFDRHTKNYGVLTDKKTGKIISFTPNYDNNNSLLANYGLSQKRTGGVMKYFINFIRSEDIKINIQPLPFEKIKTIVTHAFGKANVKDLEKIDFLCNVIHNGIQELLPYSKDFEKQPQAREKKQSPIRRTSSVSKSNKAKTPEIER